MSEFDNVVPDNVGELEPLGIITVQRKKIVESGAEGIFHLENGEARVFTDLRNAFEWSTRDAGSMHEFIFPMAGSSLAGALNYDPEKDAEVVTLSSGKRMGMSPKKRESEYHIETDQKNFFHIVYIPSVRQKHLFREDSVFISLDPKNSVPVLHFTFNSGLRSFEDLALGMTDLLKRITRITNNLLDGIYDNP